ncbi:MAG: alkylglycerone-phosphate synthase, partial [Leptospiraceae bacterium]|nr:alkylglycerone-phosphate synthase [Leptospiraceae bacterium]
DPVAQWKRIKKAASDAVLKHGGTISHHHGVGADHKSWFQQQTDKTVLSGLRAAKSVFDPEGVLNPGKLFAD